MLNTRFNSIANYEHRESGIEYRESFNFLNFDL